MALNRANEFSKRLISNGIMSRERALEIEYSASFLVDYADLSQNVARLLLRLKVLANAKILPLSPDNLMRTAEYRLCLEALKAEASTAASAPTSAAGLIALRNIIFIEKQFRDMRLSIPDFRPPQSRLGQSGTVDLININKPTVFSVDELPKHIVDLLKAIRYERATYYDRLQRHGLAIIAAPSMGQIAGRLNDTLGAVGMVSSCIGAILLATGDRPSLPAILGIIVHEVAHLEQDRGAGFQGNNFYAEKEAYLQQLAFLQELKSYFVRGKADPAMSAETEGQIIELKELIDRSFR